MRRAGAEGQRGGQLAAGGVGRSRRVTDRGEPFAHPGILDCLAAVKDLGVKLTVSTNGVLLDEERARALVELGVDGITVSLDGTDPETYADGPRVVVCLSVLRASPCNT